MNRPKMFVLILLAQHAKTGEQRLTARALVATDEEEALVKASLLAHPGEGSADNWAVLSRRVEEVDRDVLEQAAAEVLGWPRPT